MQSGSTIVISHIFIMAMEMLPQPCAFDVSSARISFTTFGLSISNFSRIELHLGRNLGRVLLGIIAQHCSTKKLFDKVSLVCTFVILKARRGIGLIKYISKYVSREVLDQVYKLYIRPHLDYGDIIYHRFEPEMHLEITKKLEQVQYSVALAVTGTWRGTSRQKLYEELQSRTKLMANFVIWRKFRVEIPPHPHCNVES